MRRDFLVLKSRRIYSLENLDENFIKFQLLDSSTIDIYTNVFYCRPIYLLLKSEKSRHVESRSVCVGLKSYIGLHAITDVAGKISNIDTKS